VSVVKPLFLSLYYDIILINPLSLFFIIFSSQHVNYLTFAAAYASEKIIYENIYFFTRAKLFLLISAEKKTEENRLKIYEIMTQERCTHSHSMNIVYIYTITLNYEYRCDEWSV
jgi:hypothetical protein